jgi:tetratricopeptide (TPR) repeat protein
MYKSTMGMTAAVLFLALIPATACGAQTPTLENVTGAGNGFVVKASDGQPVLQARVDFVMPATGTAKTTLTGRDGKFAFTGLAPTVYQVIVTAPAYEKLQLMVKVEDSSGPLILRLRRSERDTTPVSDSTVSVNELRMDGKAETLFMKGTRLLQKGDAAGSVAYFQAALVKDASYYRAHHNLGLAYYQMGRLTDAEEELQKTVDLTNGGYAPADFALAIVLCERHDPSDAQRLVETGLSMQPDSALGKYFLGLVQFELNRFAEAEQSAWDALKRNANQADAHILLARIHERVHNPYAVITDVQAYFAAEPAGPLCGEANGLLRRAQRQIQEQTVANR